MLRTSAHEPVGPGEDPEVHAYVTRTAAALRIPLADFDVAATTRYLAEKLSALELVEQAGVPHDLPSAEIFSHDG